MTGKIIKPKKLQKGDLVGLVTTSYPISQDIINKSVCYLKNIGLRVQVSKHATDVFGFMAGQAEDRANDLMGMFANREVSAVFIGGGGRTANHLLPHLDFEVFRQNPKIFMALSNPSILANVITAKTGLITFHGPTGYNFGEAGITPFTEKHMIKTIMYGETGEVDAWRKVEILRKGPKHIRGQLYGGHLLTNRSLLGTPYEPDWRGVILFLEDCFEELHDFDDSLMHFNLAGVFDKIAGLIVGTPEGVEEKSFTTTESMQDIVLRICRNHDFPILYGLDIGHTDNKVTLPIGALAELDSEKGALRICEEVVI